MTEIEPAGENKLELPMLTLIPDGEEARDDIAGWSEALGAARFYEVAQAALLNAPDNVWRVNHVRVAGLDMEVSADFSGLSNWWMAGIKDQSETVLTFKVLSVGRPGERPVFRLRRIVGSWPNPSGDGSFVVR